MARESGVESKAAQGTGTAGSGIASPVLLALVLVAGLSLGALGGAAVVGPMIVRPPAPEEPVSDKSEAGRALHLVEDVVVNPAQSRGTRFLLVSVAFEVDDKDAAARLAARDAELRDVLLDVLGNKTVEELADVSRREALKEEIRAAAQPLLPGGQVHRVYLPLYVIQ